MPNIQNLTTQQLLDQVGSAPLNSSQQAALAELNARVIKDGDADDIEFGGEKTTEGGIRPKNQPLVP